MKAYDFTIVASGLDVEADDFEDRFFEAGCGDGTITVQKGAILLDFHREARSFGHALRSAIADVAAAGAIVVRVEPDHLVSLSDIAARAGLTRAAVSQYSSGARGQGFPAPVMRVLSDAPLWDWVEVARWLHRQGRLSLSDLTRARIVRGANAALQAVEDGRRIGVTRSRPVRPAKAA